MITKIEVRLNLCNRFLLCRIIYDAETTNKPHNQLIVKLYTQKSDNDLTRAIDLDEPKFRYALSTVTSPSDLIKTYGKMTKIVRNRLNLCLRLHKKKDLAQSKDRFRQKKIICSIGG